MPCDEIWIYCYDPESKRQSSECKHADSLRTKKARQSKSTHKLLMIPLFDRTGMIYMHWVPPRQTVNKEYYIEVFKGVQQEIRSEEASTLQIGSVAFPPRQYTSPHPHPCHILFDQDGHPNSFSAFQSSRPCSLWLGFSLSSEAVVMRQLRRWKRLWRRTLTCSHKRTSMGPSRSCWNGTTSALQLEEITSKETRVPCVY